MLERMLTPLRSVAALIVLLIPFISRGQALVPQPAQLNFGIVYENAPDSLPLTLTNVLGRPVTVTGLRFYTTYGQPAFSSNDTYFIVPAGGSSTMWVKFSPRHNIYHNSELVIENDGLRGCISVDLVGQGRYSLSYYDSTENKKEEQLKSSFHTLLGLNYDTLGYVIARDSMFMQIDNKARNGQGATQNTLESVYTGALAVGYIDRTDCQNNYGFNTEHTFPQSFFNQQEPMRSDLHHLFPCDNTSNTQRSDNPFAVLNSGIIWSDGGSESDGTYFEPRDPQKGPVARALLYFVLRYQDYQNFVAPQENLLRTWHANFPPDAIAVRRNNDIFACQHNRNPFIDYPQFIERIHSVTSLSTEPTVASLDFPMDSMVYGVVAPSVTAVYRYVVVNNGNSAISLSGFSLSQPSALSFVSGGSNTTLQPGEALSLDIACTPPSTDSIRATLNFTTNLSGSTQIAVPIFVNDPVVTSVSAAQLLTPLVYPNPVDDFLNVSFATTVDPVLSVSDMLGRSFTVPASIVASHRYRLDVSALPPGPYLLRSVTDQGVSSVVFIRR